MEALVMGNSLWGKEPITEKENHCVLVYIKSYCVFVLLNQSLLLNYPYSLFLIKLPGFQHCLFH